MAKKKAVSTKGVCLHCQVEFPIQVRWCAKCECHTGSDSWNGGHDVCDRCHSGDNDYYLKRKKGSAKRIEKELARIQKEHGPIGTGEPAPLVVAFEKWVASEQYKRRFETGPLFGMNVVVSEDLAPHQAFLVSETGDYHERKVHVVGVGSGQPAVTFDLAESGVWPPEALLEKLLGAA
jgi:hypothetical protein